MFTKLNCLLLTFTIATCLLAPHAFAGASDDSATEADEMGYDAIVDQLTREHASTIKAKTPVRPTESSFDSVMMHGGVGFASFVQSVQFDDGTSATLNQKGIQAALGIDLFSPNWMAEGTARSFAEDGDSSVRSAVHEFELKALYKDKINPRFGYRAGFGMSGRYLTVKRTGFDEQTYTTPMAVATLGGDLFLNERLSLGTDLNARNALIGETIDHNSVDLTLRLDAHF